MKSRFARYISVDNVSGLNKALELLFSVFRLGFVDNITSFNNGFKIGESQDFTTLNHSTCTRNFLVAYII